jgi:hypothetical protein
MLSRAYGVTTRVMPIAIDAASGIELADGNDGNRQRFGDVFRAVWLAIPHGDRQQIVVWWHAGFAGQASPLVQLLANYQMTAAAEAFGHHLNFNADVCDLMPDAILADLIGHELSHVWHYARPASFANKIGATHQEREDEADATATGWGFSMVNLRTWANANAAAIVAATGNPNIGW